MSKYRKKPVIIDAELISNILYKMENDFWSMPQWVIDAYDNGLLIGANHPPRLIIKTLEGDMTGEPTDMLLKGVKGEIYPCKPDIFAETYEIVE